MLRKTFGVIMAVALCAMAAPGLSCAAYPERPVKMIVGWGAGGGADLVIRLVEKEFQKEFGQPLVFVYKTGANGGIAATETRDAKPDGLTLASHCNPHMASNVITKKGRYDLNDFSYIAQVAKDPVFLAVQKNSPINSLDDFIKAAKANPKMLIGCIDFYGPSNFAALKLHKTGVPYVMSSFGGGAKLVSALLGGHVDAAFLITGTSMSSISEMKPLAIAADKRDPNLPDVPTFKELGYNIENSLSRFWMAPKLPAAIEKRLVEGLKNIYADPALRERCAKAGLAVNFASGPALKQSILDSLAEYRELITYGESLKKK